MLAWNSGLNPILMGKGEEGCRPLGENEGFLGKVSGPLEEQMGEEKSLTKFVWVWCPHLQRGYDNRVHFRGLVLRQINEAQRKPLPAFTVFQGPTAQNNQYA